MAVREPVVRGRADDVRFAVFQPLFLPHHGANLSGSHGDLPGVHHDSVDEYGCLLAAVTGSPTSESNPKSPETWGDLEVGQDPNRFRSRCVK